MPEFLKILNESFSNIEKNPNHLKSSAAVSTILGWFENSKTFQNKNKTFRNKSKAFKQIQINPKNAKTFQKNPDISTKKQKNRTKTENAHTHRKKNEMECSGMFWICL